MLRRNDRADLCRRIQRIAHLDISGKFADAFDHIRRDAFVKNKARPGIAALAGIKIGPEDSRVDECIEIGVRKYDLWVLATQFERDLLQRLRGIDHGQLADARGAGERNHIN
ncbi:hypothetical protein D3C86_1450050 [compost metagenome]